MMHDLPLDNLPVPVPERERRVRRETGTDLEPHGDVVLGRLPCRTTAERAVELSRPTVRPRYSHHVPTPTPDDDGLYQQRAPWAAWVMVGAMLAVVAVATFMATAAVLGS